MLDCTQGGGTVATWVSGSAEKSFWTGVKLSGRAKFEVSTLRCTGCGYLESFANKLK